MKNNQPLRVMLLSLGCAKNTVDSEGALGEMAGAGVQLCIQPEEADVILINTCGFIEAARQEAYAAIEDMLSYKEEDSFPKVVAMGCLAQRYGSRLKEMFPGLDGVLGLAAYGRLGEYIEDILGGKCPIAGQSEHRDIPEGARLLSTPQSYAYLRVADGCDNRCSYCAIPLIRGSFKSRHLESIIGEAKQLVDGGVQELVLVAQDTSLYGADIYGEACLDNLLKHLLKETAARRIRILYAHPAHLSREVMRMLGNEERLCSYLDLPLQHINDGILKRMNRHYGRARVEEILQEKEKLCPKLVMRTSLITGFPGENDAEFDELLNFVNQGHFQYMGAFAYSPEEDTPAMGYPQAVDAEVAAQRRDALMQAQQPVTFKWLDSRLGLKEKVLVDETGDGYLVCRSICEAPETDSLIYVTERSGKRKKSLPGSEIIACLEKRNGYDIEAVL